MHILFILSQFPSYSETFVANQINDLIDKGHKITIFSFNRGAVIESSLFSRNDLYEKVIYANPTKSFFARIHRRILRLFIGDRVYQNKFVLKLSESIDVVHCHFGHNALLFYNTYLKYGLFVQAVKICTFHGYDILPSNLPALKNTYKPLFDSFDKFTYNTPYMQEIVHCFPIPSGKLRALPVGFDAGFLSKYLREKPNNYSDGDCLHLVYCGRLTFFKGCVMLPDIAETLVASNFQKFMFHIVGAGDQREELVNKIREKGLLDKFILYGALNQEDVFEVMSSSHLFILPGLEEPHTLRAETQGLVIQEAQFLKLPVLVSDAGGAKYGLISGETGYVVPQGDACAFAKKILWFVDNADQIHLFSEKSHIFARENYNSVILGKKLLDIYKNNSEVKKDY